MKPKDRNALTSFTIVFLFVIFLTSATIVRSVKSLPKQYVLALKSRLGMSYAAAGEPGGISCSTLIRQALLETSAEAETLAAVRRLQCLSPELLSGCGGQLTRVQTAQNLHAVDYSLLRPGDVAILGDGLHTLAFLEEKQWIHSDPIAGQVVILDESKGSGEWFCYPVTILRWNALSADH